MGAFGHGGTEAAGPFNKETIEAFGRKMLRLLDEAGDGPFYEIVMVTDLPLMIPEAEEAMVRFLEDESRQGVVATAICLADARSRRLAEARIRRMYRNVAILLALVSTREEAEDWISARRAEG